MLCKSTNTTVRPQNPLSGTPHSAGGGSLVFDGEDIVIDSVTCFSSGDDFSVGTVSDNGYRVLIDSSSSGVPGAQVLDADFNQWSPVNRGESSKPGDDRNGSLRQRCSLLTQPNPSGCAPASG